MDYVFGNSFVCKDMDSAKKVTFDEHISKKSVTLDGDSFDPAGMLTGGKTVSAENVMVCAKLSHFNFSHTWPDRRY